MLVKLTPVLGSISPTLWHEVQTRLHKAFSTKRCDLVSTTKLPPNSTSEQNLKVRPTFMYGVRSALNNSMFIINLRKAAHKMMVNLTRALSHRRRSKEKALRSWIGRKRNQWRRSCCNSLFIHKLATKLSNSSRSAFKHENFSVSSS